MFKKLLSNLPFNPSLIGQVSFYAKRLHRETALRRAGFVMMTLAMVLQMFAVFSPPQSSLQASPNTDLINGGFSTKEQAVNHCRNNTQDYKTILAHFGISCAALSDTSVTTIAPHDYDNKLYSMGRLPDGTPDEVPLHVAGAGTFYTRHFWQMNHLSGYKALKGTTSEGKVFFILFGCGNIVSVGIPSTPPPVDVCDNIPGHQEDPEDCDVCPHKPGIQKDEKNCDVCPNKPGTQVFDNCDVCPNKPGEQIKDHCDVCPNKPGEQLTGKECDVCPNKPGIQLDKNKCDVCPNQTGIQTSTDQCDNCPNIPGVQSDESQCKPCEQSQTKNDLTACLIYTKSAKNLTQHIDNANGTVAHAGDTIEYTLTTTNKGKVTIKDYQVTDTFGDVLDYADVTDLHGGTLGQYGVITWPTEDVKAGKSISHTVTVKIKDPLPNTPVSSSDPMHFDMKMTNVYGNTIEIELPKSPEKIVEIATTQLPNTGPGTSLVIGFTLTAFIAYFFMRSRLLAKELDIVRADFGSTGGY